MENVLSFAEVFKKGVFKIPDYQRGYAWEEPQCKDLIEDIELLPKNKEHYTGTLILQRQESKNDIRDIDGDYHALYHVVDGQQRLTTIVILLYSIRRELVKKGNRFLAEGIQKTYINTKASNERPLYKLELNNDCDGFFKKNIISETPSIEGASILSEQRLLKAKDYFDKYLLDQQKNLGPSYLEYLIEFHRKITQSLKVSLYEVKDTADVGVIFEVMNNRGKALSELEKVKNYLFYLATNLEVEHQELTKSINLTWAIIFTNLMKIDLEGSDEDQLLRANWLMAYDHVRKNWDGSKSIKLEFNLSKFKNQHKDLLAELTKYIQTLSDSAIAYCDIKKPMDSNSFAAFKNNPSLRTKIISKAEKLRRIKVLAPFLPLLIGIRLSHPQDGEAYLSMLQLCEKYAFRVYRYMGKRSNAGQSSLFKYGYEVYHGEQTLDKIESFIKELINYYCPDKDWVSFHEVGDNWYGWSGLKYFLYEYEEYLSDHGSVRVSWDNIDRLDKKKSIEHILPQTPEGVPYWEKRFTPDERKQYTHDIGNLSLTEDNSSYSNKPFDRKRGKAGEVYPCYAISSLAIERAICKYDEWTPVAVESRKKEIIDWALQRWYVEPIDTKDKDISVDEELDEIGLE
jgi:uncharacterized protein with ParB-like and HNH nuclease domain